MTAGFVASTDDGVLLIDSRMVSYGLISSGNLTRFGLWPRWRFKSAQLDPTDPSSYEQDSIPTDIIHSFSVTDAVAPIGFINGYGVACGSQRVNNVTTFFYMFSSPDTKFFCFDVMQNPRLSTGMKHFSDNSSNSITFNSAQPPLNIVGAIACPPPPPPASPTTPGYYYLPILDSTKAFERSINDLSVSQYLVSKRFIAVGSGNYAVATTFSRTLSMGRHPNTPSLPGAGGYPTVNYVGGRDGAWGTAGGIYWAVVDAVRSQYITASSAAMNGYVNIPTDRYPEALVINIDNLPFPYNAYA